jgi:hypothetical protein
MNNPLPETALAEKAILGAALSSGTAADSVLEAENAA